MCTKNIKALCKFSQKVDRLFEEVLNLKSYPKVFKEDSLSIDLDLIWEDNYIEFNVKLEISTIAKIVQYEMKYDTENDEFYLKVCGTYKKENLKSNLILTTILQAGV